MAQLAGSDDMGHVDDRDAATGDDKTGQVLKSNPARSPKKVKANSSTSVASAVSASAIDAVSISLRQAYESTLEEEIPDSFMDLLRKLG